MFINECLFLKTVENIVTKGEQFLLLPKCFWKSSAENVSESVCMWETVIELTVHYDMILKTQWL